MQTNDHGPPPRATSARPFATAFVGVASTLRHAPGGTRCC
jgi:hypothetical protein